MTGSLSALRPLERVAADGEAAPDEVRAIVANRAGIILSASTILKSDFFSNLQKMSLPECVPVCGLGGAVLMGAGGSTARRTSGACRSRSRCLRRGSTSRTLTGRWSWGVACRRSTGMCGASSCGASRLSSSRLRHALERVDAGPGGTNFGKLVLLFWHSQN
jgi:hypothetical protein